MQLVLIEHESLDMKKNMSTLRETLDQMNGATTDNQDDVAVIKSPLNSNVSTTNDTELSETNKDIDENVIKHNGAAIINGDLQIDDAQKDLKLVRESSEDNNETKSSVQDKTNFSLNVDNLVETPIIAKGSSSAANADDQTVDQTCEYSNVNENKDVTNGLKSLNSVDICSENSSVLADEKVSDSEELNIYVTDVDVTCKESAFSPYCDDKDFNISEQLLLLDKDKSMEEDKPILTDAKFTADKVAKRINEDDRFEKVDEIQPTENNDVDITQKQELAKFQNQSIDIDVIKNADDLSEEHLKEYNCKDIHVKGLNEISSVGDKTQNTSAKNETVVENPFENETNNKEKEQMLSNADRLNNAEEKTSKVAENISVAEQPVESKTSNNNTNQKLVVDGVVGNITEADEKTSTFADIIPVAEKSVEIKKNNNVVTEDHANDGQSLEMKKSVNIDVNMKTDSKYDTVDVQKEISNKQDTDNVSVDHKYITVKKLTDLTDIVEHETTHDNETNENVENKEAIGLTETIQNEVMDVDEIDEVSTAVPENHINLENASDKIQKLQTNNIEPTIIKTDVISEDSNEKNIKNIHDNAMEVDDVEELPLPEKSVCNNAIHITEVKNTKGEEKNIQEINSISITEKDSETRNNHDANKEVVSSNVSVSDNVSDVISIDDKIKEMVFEKLPVPEISAHDNAIDKSEIKYTEDKQKVTQEQNSISVTKMDSESRNNLDANKEVVSDNASDVISIDDNSKEIDSEELPVPEKCPHDNAIYKSEIKDTASEEKVTREQNSTSVTEKDSETRTNLNANKEVVSDNASDVISIDDNTKEMVAAETKSTNIEILCDDDIKVVEEQCEGKPKKQPIKSLPVICKLSNTMDILSDDEDGYKPEEQIVNEKLKKDEDYSKCINLDDDDDIMFIEDNSQEANQEQTPEKSDKVKSQIIEKSKTDENERLLKNDEETPDNSETDNPFVEFNSQPTEAIKPVVPTEEKAAKPLVSKTFLKTATKGLADMTRSEIEDFCILKLVESIADRSNLNEIKNKMKTMAQTIDDLKKKSQALIKQNRDLHLVVKTVQGDQKKRCPNPMMPMKITRSVGMQVLLSGQSPMQLKKKLPLPPPSPPAPVRSVRNASSPKAPKPVANNIPVPRLVPAVSPTTAKSPAAQNNTKPTATVPKNATQQRPEKRPHNKLSPGSSVTVDLTDDEPPAKINIKTPTPPVRLVPSQNLMPKNRPQFSPSSSNSPRKVYIPISTNISNVRPAGTGVMRNIVTPPRPRQPVVRLPNRINQTMATNRHPAPLPDAMKQYQPPTWKALPPPPDLKLSKVDNGIVISWKFEGYQPDSYEEVASFQLYAYQETPAPASTALWKKIGDIKALPLPMACTLTQFMSGFKYYFAVRAIDVRSRIGPFSMPGSIMLISKS